MPETTVRKLDPKLIIPFVKSAQEVCSTMMGVNVTVGRPAVKQNPCASHDISSIIGFSGEVVGSVVLSFNFDAGMKLAGALAGEEFTKDHPDLADAIGELSNMVAGAAKKDFGLDASITVPSVIIGGNHTVARMSGVPCLVVPCGTELGEFIMEINIKQVTKTG